MNDNTRVPITKILGIVFGVLLFLVGCVTGVALILGKISGDTSGVYVFSPASLLIGGGLFWIYYKEMRALKKLSQLAEIFKRSIPRKK